MKTLRGICLFALLPFVAAALGSAVVAQEPPLAQALPQFYIQGIDVDGGLHQGHFDDTTAMLAVSNLSTSLAGQLSTFPVGSSAGGFTYAFDSNLGTSVRSSETFGSLFGERGLTQGKRNGNVGVSYSSFSYDSIDGVDLSNGSLVSNLRHEDSNGDGGSIFSFFEGDIVETRLFLDVSLKTTLVYANYGITDRIDVGVALPYVQSELRGMVRGTVVRLATAISDDPGNPIHAFDADGDLIGTPDDNLTTKDLAVPGSGSSSGIGDVLLRGKYNFLRKDAIALAAALDVRLPTGDEDELLGSGATQIKAALIGSGEWGRWSPHFNVGYTASSGGEPNLGAIPSNILADEPALGNLSGLPNEANYSIGAEFAAHARVTVFADIIGRTLLDAQEFSLQSSQYEYNTTGSNADPNPPTAIETRGTLVAQESNLTSALAAAGLKVSPGKNILIFAAGLFSLTDDVGLQDDFTAVLGLEWNY